MVALLIVTYVFAKFQGGFASWFLFYSCVTFSVYLMLTYFSMFASLQVSREIDKDRLQDGDDLIVRLHVKRRIWFPLGWHLIAETLPEKLAGYYEPHRKLVFPWFKREFTIQYVIPSLPRGHYQLRECVITSGDFFGFVQRSKTFQLSNEVLIYPSYRLFSHWPTDAGRIGGHMNISHRRSDEVAAVRGVRDYQLGDKLSQIHWRASARGVGLKTKEYEHQAVNQFFYFLDVEKRSYQQGRPQLFELAVKLTASLVYYTSRRQFLYGFICKQKEHIRIPPGNTQTHFFRVFDQLARVMPEGEEPFVWMLGKAAVDIPKGFTIVVVTPSLDKELLMSLIQLRNSGRYVQLFRIHTGAAASAEEKQALQLLQANKVYCRSFCMADFENLQRIGGA